MMTLANCRVAIYRVLSVSSGYDVATGQKQKILEVNGFIAPLSTQTVATQEIGILTRSSYTLNVNIDSNVVPRVQDYVQIVDVFGNLPWVSDIRHRWFLVSDVAGSMVGGYRLMLQETQQ